MPLIAAGTVVLEQGVCRPGWVHTSGAQIVGCGPGAAPQPPDVDLPDAVVVPGFVDIHVHGGGGASYTDGNVAEIMRAAQVSPPARHDDDAGQPGHGVAPPTCSRRCARSPRRPARALSPESIWRGRG